MRIGIIATAAATAFMLAGCEARIGGEEDRAAAEQETGGVSPEGKAEEGKVSIKAPGLDMSINIPNSLARRARADAESKVIPPGATFSGIHIEGGRAQDGAGSQGGVEIRFSSAEAPDQVAAWYRQPGHSEFTVSESRQEGDTHIVSGTAGRDRDPFTVRLSPRQGGGTDGRLVIRDQG